MDELFGKALKGKAEELRLSLDHPQLSWLKRQAPKEYPLAIQGCNDTQVKEILDYQNITKIPRIYREFLSYFGLKSGDIFLGIDVTYKFLTSYSLKNEMDKILNYNNHQSIDSEYFVFLSQQSHTFAFFHTDQGDDPTVWVYGEKTGEPDDPFINGPLETKLFLSEYLSYFIAERQNESAHKDFLDKYALPYRRPSQTGG